MTLTPAAPLLFILSALLAGYALFFVVQKVASTIQAGLAESEGMRVSAANACSASASQSSHFTGCSSIL